MTNSQQVQPPIIARMLDERQQSANTRMPLLKQLEDMLNLPVVTFFTSTQFPVIIDDTDAVALAGFLQGIDLSPGLALMISSLGGDGVAAERIINICKSYSGTGEFSVIVPGKAKSAATMICFGANKIYMSPMSELGPVDPQVPLEKMLLPAYHIVESYNELFTEATNAQGNLEPYLQQLQRYDASVIRFLKTQIDLAEDISVRALKSGMLKQLSTNEIKEKVQMFLTPENTKTHGRPIYADQAIECGLTVEKIDIHSELWQLIYEIYIRTEYYVSNQVEFTGVSKCIESKNGSFISSI